MKICVKQNNFIARNIYFKQLLKSLIFFSVHRWIWKLKNIPILQKADIHREQSQKNLSQICFSLKVNNLNCLSF